MLEHVEELREQDYLAARKNAAYAIDLIPEGATVLTQCFSETLIGFLLLVSKERGKEIALICPETRPYLQGARLTASVAYDLWIPVTVITNDMPGIVLSQGNVEVFVLAADVITLDEHVLNKVRTLQIALASHFVGVPYYVLGDPSVDHPDLKGIKIKERDPEEVLLCRGIRTAKEGVRGYYPAFDITPP